MWKIHRETFVATSIDANDHIFLLAFAIIVNESSDS